MALLVAARVVALPVSLLSGVSEHSGDRSLVCALYRVCRIRAVVGYEGYLAVA